MVVEKNPDGKLNNNSIETNDANQKRERIVDQFSAAEQAESIGQKLINLKQLRNDGIRKLHAIDTIVRISIYMAQQYHTPDWHHFDILLIKHLRLLLDLQKDHRTDFEQFFPLVSQIFWYFCEVDEITHHFVNQLLDIWQQMLQKVDLKIKKSIFSTERKNFKLCVMFMKRVGCYAMQRKMLNVILGYVDAKDEDKFILVSNLFYVIGASTHQVYKRLVHLHRAVAAGAAAVESKKRFIIQIVNQFGAGTVVSKLIQSVWFDGQMVTLFPEFEAWLDFNLGSKTIEFCFCYEQERKMARIDKYCVGLFKVEKKSSTTEYSSAFEIEMINPMHYETMTNTTAHNVILLTKIRIELTYGILTEQLESILDILLPNKFEFTMPPAKKQKKSTGHSNNDTESSDNENESTEAIEEDVLLLVEDNIPDLIPSQKLPKSPIKKEKLEIKANIKKETKVDLVDTSIPKLMGHNVTKHKTPNKPTLTTTETSIHYEVNIKMSQIKVEKLEPVLNSEPTQLLKDSTKTLIEPTEDPPKPIEEFGQTEDIPTAIDYDDIMEATAIEEKNSDSRDSDSCDETEMQSTEMVVKAMVHCDIQGNSQSSNKVPPKPDSNSQPKAIKPPNYDKIKSIDFDQRYFDEKVAKKLKIEPDSNKENRPQNKTSVIKKKVEPIIVESINNKNKNQQKKVPVKKGRVTKPKPICSKDESETMVRRSSRSSSMKAQQKMSEQKDDVFEYDDDYDDFAVPELPRPKRKSSKGKSSTKNETKASVKRAPAKKQVNDEPKEKKPRKLYNPMESIEELDDELQPQMVEKTATSKIIPELEDDQLTTASFESHDLNGLDSIVDRVNKNLARMDETTEAKKFEELFETPCYERGQMNETVTFSYRKFASKSSYSRVRMSSDSADETQSKKWKIIQVEDE